MPSFIDDMVAEGQSLWLKMAGGAIVTPFIVVAALMKADRKNSELDVSALPLIAIGGGAVIAGALVGALLAAKDVVASRRAAGQPVPLPLKLLLGYGIWSALLWVPLVVIATFIVTILVLGL